MVTGSVHHVAVEFVVKASLKKMVQTLRMTEFSLVLSVSINVGYFSPFADRFKAHLDSFLYIFVYLMQIMLGAYAVEGQIG